MASAMQNAITFFREFGLFDVVLPFLLVFTLVFALLEKSKVLGTEGDKNVPKRNLNAMVGFVTALIVVATNSIVTAINLALPNIVLLVVIIVCFLMLVGSFYKTGELDFAEKHKTWFKTFIVLIFVAVLLIFMNAILIETAQGTLSVLEIIIDYVINNVTGAVVMSIVILAIAIAAILYIVNSTETKEEKK